MNEIEKLKKERDDLWQLLDDVDTAGDIAKNDEALFRGLALRAAAKRFKILESNGYVVFRPGEAQSK
jgi:hypothetical protein